MKTLYNNDNRYLSFLDLDARPWDFQAEECALRASVDRFNNRRYTNSPKVKKNITGMLMHVSRFVD